MNPAAVIDLPRIRAARAALDAAVAGLDARGRARLADFAAALAEGDPAAVATVNGDPMPKLRDPDTALSEPFTIRVSPPVLAALDELAAHLAADPVRSAGRPVSRQSAGRMALEAGMRALTAELAGGPPGAPVAASDPDALAVAILARLQARGAVVVGTVAEHRAKAGRPPEGAAVGRPGTVTRRPSPPLVVELDAESEAPEGDRRTASKPLPGGRRKDPPPADPPERRGADRLTAADVGQWVREGDNARRYVHRLARIGGGGAAELACGETLDLRFAQRAEGGRHCAACERAGEGAP